MDLPKIGLLSDSHGRVRTTDAGVGRLLDEGAEVLVHLGDVGTVEVIDALAVPGPGGRPGGGVGRAARGMIEAHLVFGNVDWDRAELANYAEDLGIVVDHPAGELETETGVFAYCHGHDEPVMQRYLDAGVAYLAHGHSHRTRDERVGDTRVINPGALFRADKYTVALLDTASGALTFYELPRR